MTETFDTIGDWIEDTFGENKDVKERYSPAHYERVNDEFKELGDEVYPPSGQGGMYLGMVGSEAADVVIALAGMCRRYGINLQEHVDKKMEINRNRQWEVFENGTGRHISSSKNFSHLDTL